MREAFGALDAWGFTQKTILTWAKDKMGVGDWLRGKTEHCLLAVRGKPIVELKNQTTLMEGAVRKHSQKPAEVYDVVEALCPAPRYAYLFSRYRHNEKWDCHGDEASEEPWPRARAFRTVGHMKRSASNSEDLLTHSAARLHKNGRASRRSARHFVKTSITSRPAHNE